MNVIYKSSHLKFIHKYIIERIVKSYVRDFNKN